MVTIWLQKSSANPQAEPTFMLARQVPNLVTGARLVLAVAAFAFMGEVMKVDVADLEPARGPALWAFWLFLIAAITDFADGYLARRYGWVTALGRVADPVVDKVLILGSLTYLAASPQYARPDDLFEVMPVWAVVLLLGREFLVTALRGLIESKGMEFPADRFGKIKLVSQVVYICIALGILGGIPEVIHFPLLDHIRNPYFFAGVFWLMIGLTLFSGLNYCKRGIAMMKAS